MEIKKNINPVHKIVVEANLNQYYDSMMAISKKIKKANVKLEYLMNFLKTRLSIWEYSMNVIEKYSTTVKRRNEYISDSKYLILNLLKTKSDISE